MKYTFMLLVLIPMISTTPCRQLNFQQKNENLIKKLGINLKLKNQYSNGTSEYKGAHYYYLEDDKNINSIKVFFSEKEKKIYTYYNKIVSSIPIQRQVISSTSDPWKLPKKGLFEDYYIFDCKDKDKIDCSVTFIGYYQNYVFKIYGEKAFFDKSFKMVCKELNQIYNN